LDPCLNEETYKLMNRLRWLPALAGLFLMDVAMSAETPNFEGVWELAKPQTLLMPADNGSIPFTDAGRKQYEDNKAAAAKGDHSFDLTMSRCSSPGLPRMMLAPKGFKLIQRPEVITVIFQWNHVSRQVNLRQGPPLIKAADDALPTMKGTTTGHWEGSALVTHSVNFDNKLLDNLVPNDDGLELSEHIRLRDANTLEDRITITDPDMFTKPWDTVLTFKRLPDTTFPFAEDVCLDRKDAGQAAWPH
jgi:hypothetical protein